MTVLSEQTLAQLNGLFAVPRPQGLVSLLRRMIEDVLSRGTGWGG